MTQPPRQILLGLLVLVLLAGCLVEGPARRSAERLESAIEAELPKGSSVEDAERFLERHDIEEHSYDAESRRLQGIVRDIWAGFAVEAAVQVRFDFNASGQVEDSQVEVIYTGP